MSYDKLLEVASDPKSLETPEAKKSIATLFHRDQSMYDQLLKDFDDPNKKS